MSGDKETKLKMRIKEKRNLYRRDHKTIYVCDIFNYHSLSQNDDRIGLL